MDPILFPSLIQGGLSAIQLLTSLGIRPNRPTYNIPTEVKDKLAQNQLNLNARSAGAARAQDNIFANQATTLLNAQQAGGGASNQLLAGAMAQAQTNQGLANLSASEQEDFQRRLGNLGAAQSEMAGYRDKEFEINKMQPFLDAAATKSALIESGIQNAFGAAQSFPNLLMGQNKGNGIQPMAPVSQLPMRSLSPVQPMTGGFVPQSVTTPFFVPRGNNLMFQNQDAYGSGVYRNNPWNVG